MPTFMPRRTTVVSLRAQRGSLFVLRSNILAPSAEKRISCTRLLSVSTPQSNSWLPTAAAV